MKEQESSIDAAKEFGLKELAPEVYKDLLQPTARQVGGDLVIVAKAVSIALSPLAAAVWGYDRLKGWLSAKVTSNLSKVRPEDIAPPPMHLAGAVLSQLPFVLDEEELRNMYASLLSSSMNQETASLAHVSFAHVIQQLSPSEAKLIKDIALKNKHRLVYQVFVNKTELRTKLFHDQFDELCSDAGIKNELPFVGNLLRLGILGTTEREETFGGEGSQVWGVHARRVAITEMYLTDFGRSFISTCVEDPQL